MEDTTESENRKINYSIPTLKRNEYQMQMNRILLAVIGGVVSGILRVEGILNGLGMFLVWNVIGSATIAASLMGSEATDFFPNGLRDVFLSQNFAGLMTYILVWTVVYDVVHIF